MKNSWSILRRFVDRFGRCNLVGTHTSSIRIPFTISSCLRRDDDDDAHLITFLTSLYILLFVLAAPTLFLSKSFLFFNRFHVWD